MEQLSLRTPARELDSETARKLYWLINSPACEAQYDDFEGYMDELYHCHKHEIDADDEMMGSDAGSDFEGGYDAFDGISLAEHGENFTENKLHKFRGDLLEAQFALRDCRQQLGMLAEINAVPWGEQAPAAVEADDEPIEWDEGEQRYIRKAMRTGYFDQLVGGMDDGVAKIVDIRKLWCLDESAARIGQSEADIVKSLLTAHATDISFGGEGILYESKRPGHDGDQPGVKEIKQMLDDAFDRKLEQQTALEPKLVEKEEELEAEVDRLTRIVQNRRREKEAELIAKRDAKAADEQSRYDQELREFWEQEELEARQADLQRQALVAENDEKRKIEMDARRKAAMAARYGAAGSA